MADKQLGESSSNDLLKQRGADDAVTYLNLVKSTFENEPKKYHEFLEIMVARRNKRVSINGLIARVQALFKEHENLIEEFYQYLPERNRVIHSAKDFIVKIKARFHDDKEVYRAFLQVLHSYSLGACDALYTLEQAKNLFEGHPDLIEEYQRYLPESSISEQCEQTDKDKRSPRLGLTCDGTNDSLGYLQMVKERFQEQPERYRHLLMIMKDYKNRRTDTLRLAVAVRVLLRGNPDLIQGFNAFLPEKYWLNEKKAPDFDRAADLIIKIKNRLQHDDTVIWPFVEILSMYYKEDSMALQDFYKEVRVLLRAVWKD